MADLSTINLNGTSYNLKDTTARTGLYYGVSDTAAATVAKAVTIDGITELTTGLMIAVKFTYENSAASPTLNVNSLGAKNIKQYGTTNAAGTASTTGWQAGHVVILVYDGSYWQFVKGYNTNSTYTLTEVFCGTAAATAAKVSSNATYYVLATGNCFECTFRYSNTAASALTLNVNSTGAKPIYINGEASSSSNYTLPAGKYLVYYDGTAYQIRTDGLIPISISGDAATVNGHTVQTDVPSNAIFTDTTYGIATTSTAGLLSAADKIKLDSIITSNANSPIIAVETSSFSSLPVTITSDKITENHYLVESTLSNPSAQTGDWTVTTANGSMTISGTISGSTTAQIILGRVDTTSATILVFDIASFSTLPQTVTDSRITSYHYVLQTELGTPSAQTGDWTVTTGTGTMTIDGDISGSTTLRVIIGTAGSM